MANAVVLVDRPARHVSRLLINRPDKRNAIDHEVRQGLMEGLRLLLGDESTRALLFGGVGGVFSAGGDLPSMRGLNETQARTRMQHIHALCRIVASARIPVVSAIEGIGAGAAIGLALLGDHIVVGESTKILFPFLKLGLTPDWGQLLTLPRRAPQLLEDALKREEDDQAICLLGAEFLEGYEAFQTKRTPDFKGLGQIQ